MCNDDVCTWFRYTTQNKYSPLLNELLYKLETDALDRYKVVWAMRKSSFVLFQLSKQRPQEVHKMPINQRIEPH